jgi:hypothetical protein
VYGGAKCAKAWTLSCLRVTTSTKGKGREGIRMKRGSGFERFVLSSGRITLECGCGERVVLLGREDDWYLEERRLFECACGERLTITNNRVGEEVTVAL